MIDERFGLGGNDDLDYSMRIDRAGFEMIVDRRLYTHHDAGTSINRIGGYEAVEAVTRKQLIEKWSQQEVNDLFVLEYGLQKMIDNHEILNFAGDL